MVWLFLRSFYETDNKTAGDFALTLPSKCVAYLHAAGHDSLCARACARALDRLSDVTNVHTCRSARMLAVCLRVRGACMCAGRAFARVWVCEMRNTCACLVLRCKVLWCKAPFFGLPPALGKHQRHNRLSLFLHPH